MRRRLCIEKLSKKSPEIVVSLSPDSERSLTEDPHTHHMCVRRKSSFWRNKQQHTLGDSPSKRGSLGLTVVDISRIDWPMMPPPTTPALNNGHILLPWHGAGCMDGWREGGFGSNSRWTPPGLSGHHARAAIFPSSSMDTKERESNIPRYWFPLRTDFWRQRRRRREIRKHIHSIKRLASPELASDWTNFPDGKDGCAFLFPMDWVHQRPRPTPFPLQPMKFHLTSANAYRCRCKRFLSLKVPLAVLPTNFFLSAKVLERL